MSTDFPVSGLQLRSRITPDGQLEISLAEALQPQQIAVYGRRSTGTKYLINPNKGIAP